MKKITYEDYLLFHNYIRKTYNIVLLSLAEESTQYKVNNPHDKMFRSVLDNKKEAVKFINKILEARNEEKIEESQIEKYNRKFVANDFHNKESDIIYKMKNKDIFFLIEHQSKIDYAMSYRMLDYTGEIIHSAIDEKRLGNRNYKIPFVYPIVLYTGRGKWDVEKRMINYTVVDINNYTVKQLLENDCFVFKLMLLENAKDVEELIRYLKELIKRNIGSRNKRFLQRIIYYILKDEIGEEESNYLINELKEKESDETMMEEVLRGALRENFGKGVKQEKENVICEMLKNQMEENIIKKITHVTQKELNEIKEKMKEKVS